VIEWAFVWKIAEKPLGWIGGPIWRAIQRKRAQNLIRGSFGGKLSIMLARLDGDTESGALRETIRETIRREFGDAVSITTWPEPLLMGEGHEYDVERGAYETAQKWLRQKGCDLLVWGRVKGQNVLSLRFTIAEIGSHDPEPYKLTETFDLPANFVAKLGAAIAARIALSVAPAVQDSGKYLVPLMRATAARFEPIVRRLNAAFDPDTRGSLLHSYALSRALIGEQAGSNNDLQQAVAAFRDALKEYTRERVPLDWATTQNNLGNALRSLGERESGTARLEEAVAAYRDALKEYTRERVPLQWATTQNNLGAALSRLGERESGTARLEEAVAAYRDALQERTRERVPLQWATTQNNLGTALASLGERESGTARLEEAVAAYRDALKRA
jgi:tetratricopeptide (TPR) repeat protein